MVCGNKFLVWWARHDKGYQTRIHVAARSSAAFYYDIIQDTIPLFFLTFLHLPRRDTTAGTYVHTDVCATGRVTSYCRI
jgi:hypothetical protein